MLELHALLVLFYFCLLFFSQEDREKVFMLPTVQYVTRLSRGMPGTAPGIEREAAGYLGARRARSAVSLKRDGLAPR